MAKSRSYVMRTAFSRKFSVIASSEPVLPAMWNASEATPATCAESGS